MVARVEDCWPSQDLHVATCHHILCKMQTSIWENCTSKESRKNLVVDCHWVIPGAQYCLEVSNAALSFWFGCFLALLGFLQIRLSCRSHRGSSEVLFWLFLLFSFGAAVGAWIFAVPNHFWTLTDKMLLLHQHRAMKIGQHSRLMVCGPLWELVC